MISCLEQDKDPFSLPNTDIRLAIGWIVQAWSQVKSSTIENCFFKSGILRRRIDRYLPRQDIQHLTTVGGATLEQMTKALMDESRKEDEEVAKELADEEAELVEVVEQAIGRKINKTDLSYLISNDEEIVADKDEDI